MYVCMYVCMYVYTKILSADCAMLFSNPSDIHVMILSAHFLFSNKNNIIHSILCNEFAIFSHSEVKSRMNAHQCSVFITPTTVRLSPLMYPL